MNPKVEAISPISEAELELLSSDGDLPSAANAETFSSLLARARSDAQGGASIRSGETSPSGAVAAGAGVKVTGPATLGDTILKGLDRVGTEVRAAWTSAPLHGLNGDMSMADALMFQTKMTMMTVQCDMVGKAMSKATQDIDQLVRIQ